MRSSYMNQPHPASNSRRFNEETFAKAREESAQLQAARIVQRQTLMESNRRDQRLLAQELAATRRKRDARFCSMSSPFLATDRNRGEGNTNGRQTRRQRQWGSQDEDVEDITNSALASPCRRRPSSAPPGGRLARANQSTSSPTASSFAVRVQAAEAPNLAARLQMLEDREQKLDATVEKRLTDFEDKLYSCVRVLQDSLAEAKRNFDETENRTSDRIQDLLARQLQSNGNAHENLTKLFTCRDAQAVVEKRLTEVEDKLYACEGSLQDYVAEAKRCLDEAESRTSGRIQELLSRFEPSNDNVNPAPTFIGESMYAAIGQRLTELEDKLDARVRTLQDSIADAKCSFAETECRTSGKIQELLSRQLPSNEHTHNNSLPLHTCEEAQAALEKRLTELNYKLDSCVTTLQSFVEETQRNFSQMDNRISDRIQGATSQPPPSGEMRLPPANCEESHRWVLEALRVGFKVERVQDLVDFVNRVLNADGFAETFERLTRRLLASEASVEQLRREMHELRWFVRENRRFAPSKATSALHASRRQSLSRSSGQAKDDTNRSAEESPPAIILPNETEYSKSKISKESRSGRCSNTIHEEVETMGNEKGCRERIQGMNAVATDVELDNPCVRFLFDDPNAFELESISNNSGSFVHREDVSAVEVDGRHGIEFSGYSVMRFPEHIQLGEAWTISLWTLAPMRGGSRWRNAIDGPACNTRPIITDNNILGDYSTGRYTDFAVTTLSPGWHHFAAVGASGATTYYIDGESVGTIDAQCRSILGAAGNRFDGAVPEAFGVMADLRIWNAAASVEQVKELVNLL